MQAGQALRIARPSERRLVELGTLSIEAAEADSDAAERALIFFPDDLPDGIEAKDPMLNARTKACAESLQRRR